MLSHSVDMPGETPQEAFDCHGCGACCTNLQDAWTHPPAKARSLPDDRIHRVPQPAGLRLFTWEAPRFPEDRLRPLLVLADAHTERLIALAYVLDEDTCPNHDDDQGCTIYDDRPLVCQAYPLLLTPTQDGNHLTVSSKCPAYIPLDNANDAATPMRAIARAYPDEIAPAFTVPAALHMLTAAIDLLENADAIAPRTNLDPPTLDRWATKPILDFAHLANEHGILTPKTLRDRAEGLKARLRARTHPDEANQSP